jgi:hypothetical protein
MIELHRHDLKALQGLVFYPAAMEILGHHLRDAIEQAKKDEQRKMR